MSNLIIWMVSCCIDIFLAALAWEKCSYVEAQPVVGKSGSSGTDPQMPKQITFRNWYTETRKAFQHLTIALNIVSLDT